MSAAPGYNPMRWNCAESGCYNLKHRPKIEIFAECMPGKIAFTDVDATVEIDGNFLFLEFKAGYPRDIPTGQKIYFQRLTSLSQKITAVIICGDAKTMEIRAVCVVSGGIIGEWQITNLADLKTRLRKWSDKAARACK